MFVRCSFDVFFWKLNSRSCFGSGHPIVMHTVFIVQFQYFYLCFPWNKYSYFYTWLVLNYLFRHCGCINYDSTLSYCTSKSSCRCPRFSLCMSNFSLLEWALLITVKIRDISLFFILSPIYDMTRTISLYSTNWCIYCYLRRICSYMELYISQYCPTVCISFYFPFWVLHLPHLWILQDYHMRFK
jgi:hypothetical protein